MNTDTENAHLTAPVPTKIGKTALPKERPILFSAPMVRALLDGTKTQTRRIVKLPHMNPLGVWEATTFGGSHGGRTRDGKTIPEHGALWHTRTGEVLGWHSLPGERLWVRESLYLHSHAGARGGWLYSADAANVELPTDHPCVLEMIAWAHHKKGENCPSIHMPRWASRILLEVTEVRVQRLQDISHEDAEQEGVKCDMSARSFRDHYAALWDRINGNGSWDANPWVWCVSFKRIEP